MGSLYASTMKTGRFFVVFVVLLFASELCEGIETIVRITNELGGNLVLNVDCLANYSDIRVRGTYQPGQGETFRFEPHRISKITCRFSWEGSSNNNYYNIFNGALKAKMLARNANGLSKKTCCAPVLPQESSLAASIGHLNFLLLFGTTSFCFCFYKSIMNSYRECNNK